ncbi:NotI family restriction endonuclease [Mesorhizobium sp. A623]
MSRILELFGHSTRENVEWKTIVRDQLCPYSDKKCFKIRKSDPTISIGSCVVAQGRELKPLVICPNKFLTGKGKAFVDCLHLLTLHEPGNEIHLLPEQYIPGGSVDYFLVSARKGNAIDFVGIEFQGLDTTGTVWPFRQDFLKSHGINVPPYEAGTFGVNWKMTAKTILVQLNHKIGTFEGMNKKLVLVLQDDLLTYMRKIFSFSDLQKARLGDSMHFHPYKCSLTDDKIEMTLTERFSTDAVGVAKAMDLGASSNLVLDEVLAKLSSKLTERSLLSLF